MKEEEHVVEEVVIAEELVWNFMISDREKKEERGQNGEENKTVKFVTISKERRMEERGKHREELGKPVEDEHKHELIRI